MPVPVPMLLFCLSVLATSLAMVVFDLIYGPVVSEIIVLIVLVTIIGELPYG